MLCFINYDNLSSPNPNPNANPDVHSNPAPQLLRYLPPAFCFFLPAFSSLLCSSAPRLLSSSAPLLLSSSLLTSLCLSSSTVPVFTCARLYLCPSSFASACCYLRLSLLVPVYIAMAFFINNATLNLIKQPPSGTPQPPSASIRHSSVSFRHLITSSVSPPPSLPVPDGQLEPIFDVYRPEAQPLDWRWPHHRLRRRV